MRSIGLLLFCLMLAGCGATSPAPTSVQGDRPAGEFFESKDYLVVVAKSGDTTQSLAAKYLGDANKDWMIEEYNGLAILTPGQPVAIPKRPVESFRCDSRPATSWCRSWSTTISRLRRRDAW